MLSPRNDITAEVLKTFVSYDRLTGYFTWKPRTNNNWNSRWSGKVAGCKTNQGYIFISIKHKRYLAHRLAWLYVTGKWPINQIDHKDNIRDNNKFSNLREATNQQNLCNARIKQNGLKGIYFRKDRNKWVSHIKVNYKHIHLGTFQTKQEALQARITAAKKYHGEFARY